MIVSRMLVHLIEERNSRFAHTMLGNGEVF